MTIIVYEVLREHHGDRDYKVGDHRDLDHAAAKHLVDLKVLKPTKRKPAEPAPDPLDAARSAADVELAEIKVKLKDARETATNELGTIAQKLDEARQAANAEIEALRRQVSEARAQADIELAEIAKQIEAAKAETAPANKAEGAAPANKASKA